VGALDAEVKFLAEGDLNGGGIVGGDHFAQAPLQSGTAAEGHGLGLMIEIDLGRGGDGIGLGAILGSADGEGVAGGGQDDIFAIGGEARRDGGGSEGPPGEFEGFISGRGCRLGGVAVLGGRQGGGKQGQETEYEDEGGGLHGNRNLGTA
jgi:hypothetical protein